MFSIVYGALMRGLPFPEPERLVTARSAARSTAGELSVASADLVDWRAQQTPFEELSGFAAAPSTWPGRREARPQDGAYMTANTFELVGVRPRIGRGFTSADDAPGAPEVIVLSYGLWRGRFGGDPDMWGEPSASTASRPT